MISPTALFKFPRNIPVNLLTNCHYSKLGHRHKLSYFSTSIHEKKEDAVHEKKTKNDVYKPIIGPGPAPDQPPTDFDMAVGLERLEYLAKTHGINIFDNEWLPGDRFGTFADPILVEATGDDRIIGCTGKPKTSHETIWFNVRKNHISRCVDCGQAFKVVNPIPIDVSKYLPKTPLPSSPEELKSLLDSLGIDSSHINKQS